MIALRYKACVTTARRLIRIRALALFFILALFASGLTAIPLESELNFLDRFTSRPGSNDSWSLWIHQVHSAVQAQNQTAPFLALGTDWLAFGHIVIGLGFIGLLIDPIRNEWLVTWGFLACGLLLPWAWGFGALRGIPWGWRLIDCSFGIGGFIPLLWIQFDLQLLKKTA